MSAPEGARRGWDAETASVAELSPGALPSPSTSFIGRQREIAEVRGLVAGGRLVTLIGPGGIGKTRLAIAVAQELPGVLTNASFVGLASTSDASLVPSLIADRLGLRAGDEAPLDRIARAFGSRVRLLILDNLEQVPKAAAPLAELLERCSGLHLLVTSRSPLQLANERIYEVPALRTPSSDLSDEDLARTDAVLLFLQRARMADARFDAKPVDLGAIASICDYLEGLPLGIELAAARVRHIPVRAVAANLGESLSLLEGGSLDGPRRHQALERTIAWSYELLGQPEALVFGRLGVFVGSFGPSAARAVVGEPSTGVVEMLNMLGRLVDQSLLRQAPALADEPRYNLHAVIRQYALRVIDDEDDARLRLFDYYVSLVEEADHGLRGPEEAHWADLLRRELPNVRAALAWSAAAEDGEGLQRLAAALGDFWRWHGDPREGLEWLHRATSWPLPDDQRLAARTVFHEARLRYFLGEGEAAPAGFETAIRFADAADDAEIAARARAGVGMDRLRMGQAVDATEPIAEAVTIARREGDPWLLGHVLEVSALCEYANGQISAAEETWLEARDLWQLAGNRRELATGSVDLASLRLSRGEYEAAASLLEEAVGLLSGLEADYDLPFAHVLLGLVRRHLGNLESARTSIELGAQSVVERAVLVEQVFAAEVIADWLGAAGFPQEALAVWAAAEHARAAGALPVESIDEAWRNSGISRDRAAVPKDVAERRWRDGQATEIDHAIRVGLVAMRASGSAALRRSNLPRHEALTKRELEVLSLLADGKSDGAIAEALFISPKTASVHVANIKGKLAAESRVEIVTKAMRLGLVDTPGIEKPPR